MNQSKWIVRHKESIKNIEEHVENLKLDTAWIKHVRKGS